MGYSLTLCDAFNVIMVDMLSCPNILQVQGNMLLLLLAVSMSSSLLIVNPNVMS